MAGTQEGQVPEDGNRNTGRGGVLFPGLPLMAVSVCFLIKHPGLPIQGRHYSQ